MILRMLWGFFGDALGLFRGDLASSWNALAASSEGCLRRALGVFGELWGSFGAALEVVWRCSGGFSGMVWGMFGGALGIVSGSSGVIWRYSGVCLGVP